MDKYPPAIVLGYSEASMYLSRRDADPIGAIIAIHGQRELPVETGHVSRCLVLQFDDIEPPYRDDSLAAARFSVRQREAAAIGLSMNPPTESHVKAIIEFARDIRLMEGALLCQCQAGISRSPAAALVCIAEWLGPGNERTCVESLRTLRPAAMPHRGLVIMGDRLLGRNGQLLHAMQRMHIRSKEAD